MGRHRVLSEQVIAGLVDRVRRGEPLNAVAADAGVTPQTLRRYIRQKGIGPQATTPDPVSIWEGRRLRDVALAALEQMGTATIDTLTACVGLPPRTVRNTITDLRRDGCVRSVSRGMYEVVP